MAPIRLDRSLLVEIGFGWLPGNLVEGTLRATYSALEARLGMRLAAQWSEEELDEFEVFYNAKDDEGAYAWITQHSPNYRQDLVQELTQIKNELAEAAPWLAALVIVD